MMSDKPQLYNALPLAPDLPAQPKRQTVAARVWAWLRAASPLRIWLDESAYTESLFRTDGLYGLLSCLRFWWRWRPMKTECAYCKRRFWWNGKPGGPVFCSEGCAYYGPKDAYEADDDIPF